MGICKMENLLSAVEIPVRRFQLLGFILVFPQRYHHCMAGLLVPSYGVMESACSADSK